MSEAQAFFRPGGTLPPGSQSYIKRLADDQIAKSLFAGEIVFVLDARQKGKSSLIVRSLDRLQLLGVTTVRIDLQRLGSNLQPEQWYAGILHSIGQDLGLTDDFFAFWKNNSSVGPMTRWFEALDHVLLNKIEGPVVIFVDEVDFVQSLPFSADEFFAGIRECYNSRATNSNFSRLTFCLVGVATPSQLIRNEDVTPFNVGRRVELTDFTRLETEPYSAELSRGGRNGGLLLDRIYYWVEGHPYLTQLLAAQVSENMGVRTAKELDKLVRNLLVRNDARQREPNIADSERRLLEASLPDVSKEESRSRVLELYRLLLMGEVVSTNRDPSVVSTLLLSGVALDDSGKLRIRNRLYRTIFDETWRRNNLPNTEIQRQRAASARASWKVASVSFVILSVLFFFLFRLLALTHDRDRADANSRRLLNAIRKSDYQASIALAWERVSDGNYLKAYELMQSQRGSEDQNWEYRMLGEMFGEITVLRPPNSTSVNLAKGAWAWREREGFVTINGQEVNLNGRLIAMGPPGPRLLSFVWWLRETRKVWTLNHRLSIASAAFAWPGSEVILLSEDGRLMIATRPKVKGFDMIVRATGKRTHVAAESAPWSMSLSHHGNYFGFLAENRQVYLYDIAHQKYLWHTPTAVYGILQFSPDDRLIVMPQMNPEALIARTTDGSIACRLVGHTSPVVDIDWFRDCRRIVTSSYDGTVRTWDVSTSKQLRVYLNGRSALISVNLGPDEKSVVVGTHDGALLEWDLDARPPIQTLAPQRGKILGIQVSPRGDRCATTSTDGYSVLLDIKASKAKTAYFLGVPIRAHPMCFSPDGSLLVMADTNGEILILDPEDGRSMRRVQLGGKHPQAVAVSHTGQIVCALSEGGLVLLRTWHSEPVFLPGLPFVANRICFSPSDQMVGVGSMTGQLAVLDSVTMQPVHVVQAGKDAITHVEFSRDDRWLAASSNDRNAYLCATSASHRLTTLLGHWGRVWGAVFSPDGTQLLTNSLDGTARVWNVNSGALVSVLQHGSWVSSANWAPDGRRIVTACADNYVRIFDPSNGFELMKLSGHHDVAFDAKFTPDGKTVVSVGGDGNLRIWHSDSPKIRKS